MDIERSSCGGGQKELLSYIIWERSSFLIYHPEKPFTDIPEQISLLKSRGLIIDNQEFTESVLQTYGYYKIINGYGEEFEKERENEEEKSYIDNVTFEDIYFQFELDKTISGLIIQDLLSIEQKLKTTISFIIGKKYGVFHQIVQRNHELNKDNEYLHINDITYPDTIDVTSYLDKNNYDINNGEYSNVLEIYDLIFDIQNGPLAYYRENRSHIPPWILFDAVEFGKINRYYQALKPEDKCEVINTFLGLPQLIDKGSTLYNSFFHILEMIRQFRNTFAHNSRFITSKFNIGYSLNSICKQLGYTGFLTNSERKLNANKVNFFNLLTILIIFSENGSQAKHRLKMYSNNIEMYFESEFLEVSKQNHKEIFLKVSHLPEDYKERLSMLIDKVF
jgi:abortive infection bacteriophage resistance protein